MHFDNRKHSQSQSRVQYSAGMCNADYHLLPRLRTSPVIIKAVASISVLQECFSLRQKHFSAANRILKDISPLVLQLAASTKAFENQ